MNYEQKYKEALERVKFMIESVDCGDENCFNVDDIKELFPELAESEDEKVRKEIIEYIKTGTYRKDWIAWLEKQGEQKDVRYKYLEDLLAADDIYQVSVNDEMIETAKDIALKAISKMAISELLSFKKQGEQKPVDVKKILAEHNTINDIVKTYRDVPSYKTLTANLQNWWDNTRRHLNAVAYRIGFADGESHTKEQIEWSEEDEENLQNVIDAINGTFEWDSIIIWLKSLKERIKQ